MAPGNIDQCGNARNQIDCHKNDCKDHFHDTNREKHPIMIMMCNLSTQSINLLRTPLVTYI